MKCRADQELSTGVEIVEASTTVKDVNRWTSARWGTRTNDMLTGVAQSESKQVAGWLCLASWAPVKVKHRNRPSSDNNKALHADGLAQTHDTSPEGGGGRPALGVNTTHTKKKWPQRRAFQRPVLIVADTWKSGPSSRTKIFQSALERPPPSCCDCAPLLPFPRCAEVNELTTFIFRIFLTFSLPSHNGNVASTKRTIWTNWINDLNKNEFVKSKIDNLTFGKNSVVGLCNVWGVLRTSVGHRDPRDPQIESLRRGGLDGAGSYEIWDCDAAGIFRMCGKRWKRYPPLSLSLSLEPKSFFF